METNDEVDVAGKAKFLSKDWWKNMLSAFKVWKYSPREHAIFQLSSVLSYGNVAIGTILWKWVTAKWAVLIVPFGKATWGLVVTGFAGLKMVITANF